MSNNAFNRFKSLVGETTTSVVTITQLNGDGTCQATTLAGVQVLIRGESVAVGKRAYVRNAEIIREAPILTISELTI